MTYELLLDGLLCALLLAVGLGAVLVRDLFAAIVLFIVYGLLAAIAWVRLGAIDVALAEAAIGAGLTGLLLVGAAARLGHRRGAAAPAAPRRPPVRRVARALTGLLCLGAGVALLVLTARLALRGVAPGAPVAAQLDAVGVGNAVTAVLLDLRGYDTLLEVAVLMAALVAVWSLTPDGLWGERPGTVQHVRHYGVLSVFGRLLPPLGLLVGVHLLLQGADGHGGAFQAGTVLAAVWLVAAMAGSVRPAPVTDLRVRALAVLGPVAFVLFGLAGALTVAFLAHPAAHARITISLIETLLTVSIATVLALLVLGVPRRSA